MDVVIRSNNKPVNDVTAHIGRLINDLYKVIKTKRSQGTFD